MPSMLEVFAVVTGIATVALTVRGHIVELARRDRRARRCSSSLFLEAGLYADAMLQVVYVVLGATAGGLAE